MRAVLSPLLRTQHSIVVHKIFYRKTTEAEQGVEPKFFFCIQAQSCFQHRLFCTVYPSSRFLRATPCLDRNASIQLRAIGSLVQKFHAADWVVDKHLDFRVVHR